MASAILIMSNVLVAAAGALVAVTAGGVSYILAAPVVLVCGGAAIWQVAATARGQ